MFDPLEKYNGFPYYGFLIDPADPQQKKYILSPVISEQIPVPTQHKNLLGLHKKKRSAVAAAAAAAPAGGGGGPTTTTTAESRKEKRVREKQVTLTKTGQLVPVDAPATATATTPVTATAPPTATVPPTAEAAAPLKSAPKKRKSDTDKDKIEFRAAKTHSQKLLAQ